MTLLYKLLSRTNTVDDILRAFDKYRARLERLSARLLDEARKEEIGAEKKLARARVAYAEASRATIVADRFGDLVK